VSFDIEQVLKEMGAAIGDTAQKGSGAIESYAQTILEKERKSLQELAEARVTGEIDEATFNQELERERLVVETELLTGEIMTKALVQKAVNAALEVFNKAVQAAI